MLHAVGIGLWAALNMELAPQVPAFDPYPFHLLTLVVSAEAVLLCIAVLIRLDRMKARALKPVGNSSAMNAARASDRARRAVREETRANALATPPVSVWQVTLPSAAMARIEEPSAHVLLTRRCRYVVSAATVPLTVIVPPVSPVPAVTLVTVPAPPASAAHVHALPFHFGIWLLAHACGSW